MSTTPAKRWRLLQRRGKPRPRPPENDPEVHRRARTRLVVGGLAIALVLSGAGVWARQLRGPARPPTEVQRIAAGLRAGGHAVDRVAANTNGGWSVLFDDGEVQWFKSPKAIESQLHTIRVLYEARHDPNIAVLDLHPTVFVILLSGRRQGSTLELGTSPTTTDMMAAMVRAAVGRPHPARPSPR